MMTEELQNEIAQTEREDAPSCRNCQAPFRSHYFQANGANYCNQCAETLRAFLAGHGSKAGRFLRALLLGSGAAALGALGYGLFMGLTGYEFAYVTIGIGWLIGASVRKGSGGRGGWRYGVLAVLLTYSAIAFSYFGVGSGRCSAQAFKALLLPISKQGETAPAPAEAASTASEKTSAIDRSSSEEKVPSNPVMLAAFLLGFAFVTPIIAATQSILSAVIIGFGLWKAWSMNRAVQLEITGPHSVEQLAPAPAA
jgi:hypothetical protein